MKSAFLSTAARFDYTTPSLQAMKMKMKVKKRGTEAGQLLRTGDLHQIVKSKNYGTFCLSKLLIGHQEWVACVQQLARSLSSVAR